MTPISKAYAEILITSGSRAIPKFPFSGSFVIGSASRSGSGESTIRGLRHHYSKTRTCKLNGITERLSRKALLYRCIRRQSRPVARPDIKEYIVPRCSFPLSEVLDGGSSLVADAA